MTQYLHIPANLIIAVTVISLTMSIPVPGSNQVCYGQSPDSKDTASGLSSTATIKFGQLPAAGLHTNAIKDANSEPSFISFQNDGIRVGPNPFTPNNNGFNDFVTFDFTGANPNNNYTIRIFSMNGTRVRTLSSNSQPSITWNGGNDSGSTLKPGVYIYTIEGSNGQIVRRGSITLAL